MGDFDASELMSVSQFANRATTGGVSWVELGVEFEALLERLGLARRDESLDRMIRAQVVFQDRLKAHNAAKRATFFEHPLTETRSHGRTLQLVENLKMLAAEVFEAHAETPWKMHKTDFGREMTETEVEAVAKELIDCLHFLLNCFIMCGYTTAEQIEQAFFQKNAVNHDRQDAGY